MENFGNFNPNDLGPALIGAVCGGLCGLAIGLAIGAVILRSACGIYNSIARSDTVEFPVPMPSFGWAMLIVLVGAVVGMILGFLLGLLVGIVGTVAGLTPGQVQLVAQLLGLPLGFLINAGAAAAMLPTSFGKAMLVTLIEYLIILLIVLVVGAVVIGMLAATGGLANMKLPAPIR